MTEKKVITKPIDYAIINQLSTDFETRFVPQTELSAEKAFWFQYSVQTDEPNLFASTTIVEVPKELPKVNMVNSCLKKLKFNLASFDMVVKERTTATAITEGTKTKAANKKVPVSNSTITKSLVANNMEPNNSWGSSSFNVPSSLIDCRFSKSSFGTWTPIMGYGDYQIGNVTISRVYYVEGLGHNLFSVGKFCDSDLEVAFRQHTMAFEQSSSGPALNEMTPGTINSGLVQKSSPSTSYVPPSRNDWDLLFQPMFDELPNPPPSVVNQAPEVIAPIAEPKTYKEALTQSCWIEAMQEELNEFE
nr:integrase, catalytic region, zinc finger, CCHC-type, peptidase aspartic, catalytic [Tanacetum cinerariifolium]